MQKKSKYRYDLMSAETSETLHSDYTLFFGHYPTGTVLTADGSSTLRRMLSGKVYLCGHLHNFIALANR